MALPHDLDDLSSAELKVLVLELLAEVAALKEVVAQQRAEIARLKGLKGPPSIKPSGMAQASEAKPPLGASAKAGGRGRGRRRVRVVIEERVVKAAVVPPGSRFKGYESYLVQDLVLRPLAIRFRRERWMTPEGHTVVAPLPPGIDGHFGPDLRRFVLAQYHQGQVTVPRLVALLDAIGIQVSKRQIVRLLIGRQDRFRAEAEAVMRAGLESATWIAVDDTGARHQARNGFCTYVGNDRFAWFATTGSKSRLNFLELLRAGHDDYVINADAIAYLRGRALAGPVIHLLATHADGYFADRAAWQAHLDRFGIPTLQVTPDPVRIATEGALWGSIKAHGLLRDTVILSDDAGQFDVGRHALCWVHAERLVHKLDTFTDQHHAAQQRMRHLIWWFYRDLRAYCRDPTAQRKAALRARFDRIFRRRTGFATLDRLLARLYANKAELLMALDRPDVPLHTNSAENDIRCQVIRRKISGGTRSDQGRDCRDAFLGLAKTCAKLGISFWDYLGARLIVEGSAAVPYLPPLVAQPSRMA
ncbi:MAG: IS66 family transposase [Stellaceae bacterium]